MSSPTKEPTVDLDQLSKDELINHIRKQNDHISQLKNLLIKKDDSINRNQEKGREFDFAKYSKKHIALKFFYLGWNYEGFVEQENTKNTVEDCLFAALIKSKLIESRQTSNYHRCGRTDKGVSAFSQLISLDLRSKVSSTGVEEIKYCKILNKLLPRDIRCISSAEVDPDFSARFSCKSRTYKYFFPIGTLNLELMEKAALSLVGTHDFRNFCKLDKTKLETNFERTVESVKIIKFRDGYFPKQDIYELEIRSTAFLWHQIRNIVSVLFCIGDGKEQPELITELLDLSKFEKKPQYSIAYELPLVLFDCEFDINNWEYDGEALKDAVSSLNAYWLEHTLKSTIILKMLNDLKENQLNITEDYQKFFVRDLTCKVYKKLKERPTCDTELSEQMKAKITNKNKHRQIDKAASQEPKRMKTECSNNSSSSSNEALDKEIIN